MVSERTQRQINRLLDEAEQAITDGNWPHVESRYDAVLRLEPGNVDAANYLAAARREPGTTAGGRPLSMLRTERGLPPAVVPAPLPDSFVSGRYQVTGVLGEGGKKVVYRAHNAQLDRDVAFAVIRTEGLDEAGRERVKREAQALGRPETEWLTQVLGAVRRLIGPGNEA